MGDSAATELLSRLLRSTLGPIYRMLPMHYRRSIRAMRLRRIVRRGDFRSEEIEYSLLTRWLTDGDTAVDIGANFGSYSVRMSQIVGVDGLVFAFEPVPQTFALLGIVLESAGCENVLALNVACSNRSGLVSISIPDDPLSGEDLYQASILGEGPVRIRSVCIRIDDLALPLERLKLVKVDAEGHDAQVIEGMWATINRLLPVLIIEHPPDDLICRLVSLGYSTNRYGTSPNTVFLPPARPARAT